jgi:hypothetical protein
MRTSTEKGTLDELAGQNTGLFIRHQEVAPHQGLKARPQSTGQEVMEKEIATAPAAE